MPQLKTIIVNRIADGAISHVATANEVVNIGCSSKASSSETVSYRNDSDQSSVTKQCNEWSNSVVTNESQETTTNSINVVGHIITNNF